MCLDEDAQDLGGSTIIRVSPTMPTPSTGWQYAVGGATEGDRCTPSLKSAQRRIRVAIDIVHGPARRTGDAE